jgi:HTH-type transcriptional regulator / antitoxin HipB
MDPIPCPVRNSDQLALLLRNLRLSRRMTQRDLADRLGLSQPRVAEIEKRPGRITVDQLFAVMQVLGATALVAPGRGVDLAGAASAQATAEKANLTIGKQSQTPEGEW